MTIIGRNLEDQHFHDVDKATERKEQALKKRAKQMRNDEFIEYVIRTNAYSGHYHRRTPSEMMESELDYTILREAFSAWLKGDVAQAEGLFVAACEKAFDDAVEFLADNDVENFDE